MKKILMALLASSAGACAVAQTHPMSVEAFLASAKKPPSVSVELLRASGTCGPLVDCTVREPRHGYYGLKTDPCVSSPFGCQLSSSSSEWKSSGYFGGAKLSAEIGGMSFTFGRHRDNLVLTQATFVEGAFRVSGGSLVVGALRGPRIGDALHNGVGLAYVAYRMTF